MKSSDRSIMFALLILAGVAAFWFLLIAPKRERASELSTQIESLNGAVQQAEATLSSATLARDNYDSGYRRLVVLGKAVPADSDTPSLIIELQELADEAEVDFQSLELKPGEATAAALTEETTTDQNEEEDTSTETAETTPAPATEAGAAGLPLGATVGPASLAVMPYELSFEGGFFQVADFMEGLDRLVNLNGSIVRVEGRLFTIDGFEMTPAGEGSSEASGDSLTVSLTLTSYVSPESQGTTAGASPTAPAASVPAASTTSTSTP